MSSILYTSSVHLNNKLNSMNGSKSSKFFNSTNNHKAFYSNNVSLKEEKDSSKINMDGYQKVSAFNKIKSAASSLSVSPSSSTSSPLLANSSSIKTNESFFFPNSYAELQQPNFINNIDSGGLLRPQPQYSSLHDSVHRHLQHQLAYAKQQQDSLVEYEKAQYEERLKQQVLLNLHNPFNLVGSQQNSKSNQFFRLDIAQLNALAGGSIVNGTANSGLLNATNENIYAEKIVSMSETSNKSCFNNNNNNNNNYVKRQKLSSLNSDFGIPVDINNNLLHGKLFLNADMLIVNFFYAFF
jgi:hypothetical protein